MTWVNPCAGLRWQVLESGLIEIEGAGLEYARPGELDNLKRCWANWGPQVRAAAEQFGVPIPWILAIMVVETGLWSDRPSKQASMVSSAGAIGLMQVMPMTARGLGFTAEAMFDPVANVAAGTKLISQLRGDGLDLPSITAKYNSGGLCSTGRNVFNLRTDAPGGVPYSRMAIQVNNSAVDLGIGETSTTSKAGAVGALLFVVGGALVLSAYA